MPSFKVIELPVLEKILKAFTIYGYGGHLDQFNKVVLERVGK